MKKAVIYLLLSIIFLLNVKATIVNQTFAQAKEDIKLYINQYEDYEKYIMNNSEMPFIYKNSKVLYSSEFNGNSGLLNEDEIKIGKDYLYNGINYWIISNDNKYSDIDPIYKDNDYINKTKNKSDTSGVRPTVYAKSTARVSGDGSRMNPFEFAKREYEVIIYTVNATAERTPLYIIEGETGYSTITPSSGYAFDNVICTNSQEGVYEDGKLKIRKISANTECTISFVNPGTTITYKEKEQTYEVKYDGYYKIDAYGAQGNGSGGKGGHTSGVIFLNKGETLTIKTGGQNGYNGGGSGYYNGGGATNVNKSSLSIMIAAGGGGGKDGTAGGNGDSKGGEISGKGSSGKDGTNQGGGGSGYNDMYYSSCAIGHNTCKGGTIDTNCSSCYTGSNTCQSGCDTRINPCITGSNTCQSGTTDTCIKYATKYYDSFSGTNTYKCMGGKWSFASATDTKCLYGKQWYCNSPPTGSCTNGSEKTINCSGRCYKEYCAEYEVDPCKTGSNTCVAGEEKYNCSDCYTGSNTCQSGCDSVYSECASGENTCKAGYITRNNTYKSGHGGTNKILVDLKKNKNENGINSGNGRVIISYYGEVIE